MESGCLKEKNRQIIFAIRKTEITYQNYESGNILTEQKDIIQENRNHYKSLYTCRTGNLFNDNVNKLSEDDKNSLEGKLTYEEMLSALKKMRNNSAPGNSGFTVSFYKFFWILVTLLFAHLTMRLNLENCQ